MKSEKKANAIRAVLLSFTNREIFQRVKTGFQMKINGKTSRQMSAEFQEYEIQINNPVVTGFIQRTKKNQHYQLYPIKENKNTSAYSFFEFDSNINSKKVLCSKLKLKKHSENDNNTHIDNIDEFPNSLNDNNLFKNSAIILKKIVNSLKIVNIRKWVYKSKKFEGPSLNSLLNLYENKERLNPKRKSLHEKKNSYTFTNYIFKQEKEKENNEKEMEYDFKICLHEIRAEDFTNTKLAEKIKNQAFNLKDKVKTHEKSFKSKGNKEDNVYIEKNEIKRNSTNFEELERIAKKKQLNFLNISQKTYFIKKFLKERNNSFSFQEKQIN